MNRAETLGFAKHLPIEKTLFLRGNAGIGKTSFVREFAKQTTRADPISLYPAEMEPTDAVGLPFIKDGRTHFAEPWWWPDESRPRVLFIEEIDRCLDQMFPVIMQLIENRTAGGRKLPHNCRVIAAGNGEKFQTRDLDQGLMRRLAVVDYKPTVEEWLVWAEREKIEPTLVSYIRATPDALDTPGQLVGKPNISIKCRATWADCSDWLRQALISGFSPDRDNLVQNLAPFVGTPAATGFAEWFAKGGRQLKIADVFAGTADPKQVSMLEATHVAGSVAGIFMSVGKESRVRALDFFTQVSQEAFASLFSQLPKTAMEDVRSHKKADELVREMMRLVK